MHITEMNGFSKVMAKGMGRDTEAPINKDEPLTHYGGSFVSWYMTIFFPEIDRNLQHLAVIFKFTARIPVSV